MVGCWEVAESNGQHDVGGPVDWPDILLGPGDVAKAVFDEPAVVGAEAGHGSKNNADDVGIAEIYNKYLSKFPILLVIYVSDEVYFYFLYFLNALRQFEYDEDPEEGNWLRIGGNVNEKDDKTDTIDPEILMDVVFDYIFDDVDSFSGCKFDGNKIQYDFYEIEDETADLDCLDEGVLTTEKILKDEGDWVDY